MIKSIMKQILEKIAEWLGLYDKDFCFFKGSIEELKSKKNKKVIAFFADDAWNSVEYILPLLVYIKQRYDCFLVVCFMDQKLHVRLEEEQVVSNILASKTDIVIINKCPRRTDYGIRAWMKRKLKGTLYKPTLRYMFDKTRVDVLLRVWTHLPFVDYFFCNHPETKQVATAHSGCCCANRNYDEEMEASFSRADLWMFPDQYTYNGSREDILSKMYVTGAFSYDLWWRRYLKFTDKEGVEKIKKKCRKKILIALPLLSDKTRFSDEERQIVKMFVIKTRDKYDLILKFHPREDAETIKNFCEEIFLDEKNVSRMQLVVLSSLVDCVIFCGGTTAVGDALINNVPVIEFYTSRMVTYWYLLPDGKNVSFFTKHRMTVHACTYKELYHAVNGIFHSELWADYNKRYKDYIVSDNCACARAANLIMRL